MLAFSLKLCCACSPCRSSFDTLRPFINRFSQRCYVSFVTVGLCERHVFPDRKSQNLVFSPVIWLQAVANPDLQFQPGLHKHKAAASSRAETFDLQSLCCGLQGYRTALQLLQGFHMDTLHTCVTSFPVSDAAEALKAAVSDWDLNAPSAVQQQH